MAEVVLTKNRRRLLDIVAGGTGHAGNWVEVVTYEATGSSPEHKGAIVHTPAGNGKTLDLIIKQERIADMLYFLSGDFGKDNTEEEREAAKARLLSDTDIIDTGRRITAEMQERHRY